jgi:hypothetical protein
MTGDMVKGVTLEDLLSADMFLGTSLILRRSEVPPGGMASLLYGVRAPLEERGQLVLEVTGIGGGVGGHRRLASGGRLARGA